ncbi:MFS transporter [Streptomyces sp. MBT60]|uniref:MFS transporter n=1 Tax=Streptomyces sp. MBT60 TaxID=2800409 RepID=UPI001F328F2C|nr:MFS transporter [Streptomyces sp. MBT60]
MRVDTDGGGAALFKAPGSAAFSATFTLSMALCGPQISRVVDRRGQSRVLLPAAGLSVIAMGVLLLCARYDAPVWTLFVSAVLAGTMPNTAAMVRARWTHAYRARTACTPRTRWSRSSTNSPSWWAPRSRSR